MFHSQEDYVNPLAQTLERNENGHTLQLVYPGDMPEQYQRLLPHQPIIRRCDIEPPEMVGLGRNTVDPRIHICLMDCRISRIQAEIGFDRTERAFYTRNLSEAEMKVNGRSLHKDHVKYLSNKSKITFDKLSQGDKSTGKNRITFTCWVSLSKYTEERWYNVHVVPGDNPFFDLPSGQRYEARQNTSFPTIGGASSESSNIILQSESEKSEIASESARSVPASGATSVAVVENATSVPTTVSRSVAASSAKSVPASEIIKSESVTDSAMSIPASESIKSESANDSAMSVPTAVSRSVAANDSITSVFASEEITSAPKRTSKPGAKNVRFASGTASGSQEPENASKSVAHSASWTSVLASESRESASETLSSQPASETRSVLHENLFRMPTSLGTNQPDGTSDDELD